LPTHHLNETERRAWLRLARTSHVGPVTFANLLSRFGSAAAALAEVPQLARRGGGRELFIPAEDAIARELDRLAKMSGRMIASCEAEFPHGLAALDAPPPCLMVLGHTALLQKEMVAIVGARNASALGRKLAARLSADLGAAGLTIASGLARGIDAAAHEATLSTGTCAVVAGGVDIVYPPENQSLYDAICKEGVIVSEMALGQAPQARHFPRRNRIISGLSRGVVVVEAAIGSGSLITANYALEQGREIFAVPGSPLDPRAKGANRLIRQGATLTESAEDILNVLHPMLGHSFAEPERPPDPTRAPAAIAEAELARLRTFVEEALGPAPIVVDELIRMAGAHPAGILTVILELELAGRLTRHPGNGVSWA